MFRIVYWLAYIVLYPFYRFSFIGRENIPEGGCLICANHTGNIDPVLVVLSMGPKGNYAVMAKSQLFKNRLFGAVLKWLRAFPVHRGGNDVAAVKTAFSALKEGRKLIIFPEGTRVRKGEDAEAKLGAGMFALRGKVPVVPVYVTPGKKAFRKNRLIFGTAFYPQCEGKPKSSDYRRVSEDIMRRVAQLGEDAR